jgi:GNAT superfamily N-acetyltransferase
VNTVSLPAADEIVLRPMEDGDFEYILKSWLRAHCHGSKEAQLAGKSYWTEHRQLVMNLLGRAATLVATWSKDPHLVIGFTTTEAGKVHFVYVRRNFWRMGIARRLLAGMLAQENVIYTHRTHMIVGLPVPPTWSYNPYEAR